MSGSLLERIRGLPCHEARSQIRQGLDIASLEAVVRGERRRSLRQAAEARIRKLEGAPEWAPVEADAVVRVTVREGEVRPCPRCQRRLPVGPGLDEIGIRRRRRLRVDDTVIYTILPQSRCHRCQRQESRQRKEKS